MLGLVSQTRGTAGLMSYEGNWKIIVEKAKVIEKEIKQLIEKISFEGTGIEILRTGLKKTAVSVVYYITLYVSVVEKERCLKYLQKAFSQLKVLEYYNFISRKVGYFSSTPYLQLEEKIKEMEENLSLSPKNLKGCDCFLSSPLGMNNQPDLENEGETELRHSPQIQSKEEEKLLVS